MTIISRWGLAATAGVLAVAFNANAQEKHYRFAHDQQLNSGYSVAYDIFSAKLKQLSGGKILVDQYPGAQLGQEPQLLQLVKSGDLDFAIVSSANTATISPQAGVMSLHFLFRDENHMVKALAATLAFGLITPPYGLVLLMASKFVGVRFSQALRAALPIYVVFFATIAFCIFFPEVVLWLPKQVLPTSVGCFQNPSRTGLICPHG
jgi:Bacterial extracellular solute-binding protein, family 7